MQQLLHATERERPRLLTPIAVAAWIYAVGLCACGIANLAHYMSLRLGAVLLGSGLEVMGPAPYFFYALAVALGGWGMMRGKNWGRYWLIVICAGGVVFIVPHISSAVIDERWWAMGVDGAQIVVRVAIATYLWREAEWFRS